MDSCKSSRQDEPADKKAKPGDGLRELAAQLPPGESGSIMIMSGVPPHESGSIMDMFLRARHEATQVSPDVLRGTCPGSSSEEVSSTWPNQVDKGYLKGYADGVEYCTTQESARIRACRAFSEGQAKGFDEGVEFAGARDASFSFMNKGKGKNKGKSTGELSDDERPGEWMTGMQIIESLAAPAFPDECSSQAPTGDENTFFWRPANDENMYDGEGDDDDDDDGDGAEQFTGG